MYTIRYTNGHSTHQTRKSDKKRAQDGPDWRCHCARDTDDKQVSDQEELTMDR